MTSVPASEVACPVCHVPLRSRGKGLACGPCAVTYRDARVLQKMTVHENTWHSGVTYHWDFSRRDYERMVRGAGCRIRRLSSRSFFFPRALLRGAPERFRAKQRFLSRLPLIRFLGSDLVVVAKKPTRVPSTPVTPSGSAPLGSATPGETP